MSLSLFPQTVALARQLLLQLLHLVDHVVVEEAAHQIRRSVVDLVDLGLLSAVRTSLRQKLHVCCLSLLQLRLATSP